jgi:hypothetical protein
MGEIMSTEVIVYIVLGLLAIAYAFILNTAAGKSFADQYTWASVVIGTSLVLGALWFIIPADNWQKVFLAFVVAGTPMILRSLLKR